MNNWGQLKVRLSLSWLLTGQQENKLKTAYLCYLTCLHYHHVIRTTNGSKISNGPNVSNNSIKCWETILIGHCVVQILAWLFIVLWWCLCCFCACPIHGDKASNDDLSVLSTFVVGTIHRRSVERVTRKNKSDDLRLFEWIVPIIGLNTSSRPSSAMRKWVFFRL